MKKSDNIWEDWAKTIIEWVKQDQLKTQELPEFIGKSLYEIQHIFPSHYIEHTSNSGNLELTCENGTISCLIENGVCKKAYFMSNEDIEE